MSRFLRWSSALFVCVGLSPAGLQAQTVSLEPGTDRMGGGDYKHIVMEPGANPSVCQTACADDAACKSYSYVKAGIKGPKPVCFLKSSRVPATPNACCTSGVKGTPKLAPPKPAGDVVSIEPGTDRLGADYKGFELDNPNASLCQQACAQDAACKAFAYVKPGIKGPKAMCFLKSTVAPATANSCCTSGAKGQGHAMPIKVPKASGAEETVAPVALHHFYEKKKDFFHFYTTDAAEMEALKQQPTWEYVGITAYVMPKLVPGTVPFFRLVKSEFGGTNHFYTAEAPEAQKFTQAGWKAESLAGYIAKKQLPGTVPLYRFYLDCQLPQDGKFRQPCEDAIGGDVHYYTADEVEKHKAVYNGMRFVRIEGYVWKSANP